VLLGSPIVVDLAGDKISLTDRPGGVAFPIGADNFFYRVSWTAAGSDDAWLVLDRNGNGRIDNGRELFGNFTPQPDPPAGAVKNGFLALAEFDRRANGGNRDGRIDARDAVYPLLRLWRDTNHDADSQPGELTTLAANGVIGFDLDYKDSKRVDQFGNGFRFRAKVYSAQGTPVGRWAWDVVLDGGRIR
jgi:hypothetical protein